MAMAKVSCASLLIDPNDIAPVVKRLTISFAGSTSSSGGFALPRVKHPNQVQISDGGGAGARFGRDCHKIALSSRHISVIPFELVMHKLAQDLRVGSSPAPEPQRKPYVNIEKYMSTSDASPIAVPAAANV